MTELALLQSMGTSERQVHLQEQQVRIAEGYLQSMVDDMQQDNDFVQYCVNRAHYYLDDDTEVAQQWVDLANAVKQARYTIADIRKQRGVVQWERKTLAKIRSSIESSQSSSH